MSHSEALCRLPVDGASSHRPGGLSKTSSTSSRRRASDETNPCPDSRRAGFSRRVRGACPCRAGVRTPVRAGRDHGPRLHSPAALGLHGAFVGAGWRGHRRAGPGPPQQSFRHRLRANWRRSGSGRRPDRSRQRWAGPGLRPRWSRHRQWSRRWRCGRRVGADCGGPRRDGSGGLPPHRVSTGDNVMIRSVVLFTHVVGMLLLFVGFAFEWLSLKALRRATTLEHAASWVRLQDMLPRVYGLAIATIFVSGVLLARRIGAFELAWVRLALGLLLVMGILGAFVQSRLRAMRHAAGQSGELGFDPLRLASSRWLGSLLLRAAMGLAAVYLMIG